MQVQTLMGVSSWSCACRPVFAFLNAWMCLNSCENTSDLCVPVAIQTLSPSNHTWPRCSDNDNRINIKLSQGLYFSSYKILNQMSNCIFYNSDFVLECWMVWYFSVMLVYHFYSCIALSFIITLLFKFSRKVIKNKIAPFEILLIIHIVEKCSFIYFR